ncbi:SurA N-terminal domain-containing protein [Bacillus suaedaesalsae]|uniref:SurA N-terminal domain-containing protein n=1 Tax=Bacillus suaedaesalsae TaxID=2810349 RepID=A0ABS2DF53_9BACI|nr:SurA N-terminal domain-containing protein [Bacillus suaedaesalsae]MBM6617041.1 SurA N-terminal domain-containing protein [Bacillus suaedaesalsae]
MIKKVGIALLFYILLSIGLDVLNIGPQVFSLNQDQVVATVNEEKIYKSDLQTAMKSATPKLSKDDSKQIDHSLIQQQIEQKALEKLIHKELLLQEAKKENFQLSKEEKQKALEQIEEHFTNESELENVLDKYNLSEHELKEMVEEELLVATFLEKKLKGLAEDNRQEELKLFLEQLKKKNKINIQM